MPTTDPADEILDVLIVGAGISGIGLACTLVRERPATRWRIFEARSDLGGTWDLFRYPGIRSDSDLFTFGYAFKPWRSENAIATAESIQDYVRETAAEHDVLEHIRYGHHVVRADWDGDACLWTVHARRAPEGDEVVVRARWLFGATGYYDYEHGYRPSFPDEERFAGPIAHPQHWPDDLDWTDKRVAIIGSGATAVTLVPALAEDAAHVTQVQRTPSYVVALPSVDRWFALLRRVLPEPRAFALVRAKNIKRQQWFYSFCRRYPRAARRLIQWTNRRMLPADFDVDTHFTPPYEPWDQRICVAPDGDYFHTLSRGDASIVTGAIARFTEDGIEMSSGELVPADVIVTATGLTLKVFGGARLFVDGREVDAAERLVFKGMMLDAVPNFAFAVGYTTSSWTLKVGLLCDHFCRLLAHMEAGGFDVVRARRPDGELETRPLLDFGAGYVKRSLEGLPRQGVHHPWHMTFDYGEDEHMMRAGPVIDPALEFLRAPSRVASPSSAGRSERGSPRR